MKAVRLLTRPITANFLLLAVGCTGGRAPTPAAAPEADPPADPAAATTPALPTCDSWAEWNFFGSASGVWVCLQAGTDANALVEDGYTILRCAATFADTELPL